MPSTTYDVPSTCAVHDARYDSVARRLATACSDGVLRIFAASGGALLGELRGHQAPALSVSWGAGHFGFLLASGADDGSVVVWREPRPQAQEWSVEHRMHVTGAANVVAFCPPEYGLGLAVAGGDELGVVTVLLRNERNRSGPGGEWMVRSFPAHEGGVAALSWTPSTPPATMATGPAVGRAAALAPRRLATCGADGAVCVWQTDAKMVDWSLQFRLTASAFVGRATDVAWQPSVGLPTSTIAACSDEGCVGVWVQDMDGREWRQQSCWQVPGEARRLAWAPTAGTLLSVAFGDAGSALYRRGVGDKWELVSPLEE